MKRKEVDALLVAINSTNDLGFKYPFGNIELTNKLKTLEANNVIFYSEVFKTWRKVTKPKLSPTQKAQGELAKEYGKHLDNLANDKTYQETKRQAQDYINTLVKLDII